VNAKTKQVVFCPVLILNMIVLPRQARDELKESTQKRSRAFSHQVWGTAMGASILGKETPFLRHIYSLFIKCVVLPRQARDKHRENSKKEWRFLRVLGLRAVLGADVDCDKQPRDAGAENSAYYFEPFLYA
jgi:hypothetical protein